MSSRIANKIALITGGCSGIGLAIATLFLQEGARIVVADLQDDKGDALARQFPDRLVYRHCDVTVEADIAAAVAATGAAFGGIDILVNNAGAGGAAGPLAELAAAAWDGTQALLLRAPALGIKHVVPAMTARGGGAIVNIASIAGLEAGWGLPYGVAKAGVIQLSKLAAAELAAHNIRVNAISPGVIVTPIFGMAIGRTRPEAEAMTAGLMDAAARMQPLRRAGLPEDVAYAALYLASDEARFVTGTNIVVDGGITTGERFAWDEAAPAPLLGALGLGLAQD